MKKALLILVFILAASTSFAQSLAIGPQLGYFKSKDADDGAYIFSGAARFSFLMFGVEGTVGYSESKYFNGDIKIQNYPISITGMVNIMPFIYADAGMDWFNRKIIYNIPGISDETSTSVGYHIGVGAQISLGPLLLTGDAKYIFTDKYKLFTGVEVNNNYYILSIGVLYKIL